MTYVTKNDSQGPQDRQGGAAERTLQRAPISVRLRQPVRVRGGARRAAGRAKVAAAAAARPLRRADLRHLVHDRARGEPAHLDLPHPALGRAPALCAHRQRAHSQRAVQRGRRDADAIALESRCRFRKKPTDFVEGIVTLGGNGDVATQVGMAVHIYAANRSMTDRYFYNADGEMLIVPQQGRARFVTELGIVEAAPGEIAVIPRGLRFRVELPDGPSRGYVCENYGAMLRLPELGPLGSNGLANPRDFLAPVAAYEDTRSALRRWSPNSRAICGRRRWIIRRSTSSPGTAILRRTNTTSRASW